MQMVLRKCGLNKNGRVFWQKSQVVISVVSVVSAGSGAKRRVSRSKKVRKIAPLRQGIMKIGSDQSSLRSFWACAKTAALMNQLNKKPMVANINPRVKGVGF